MYLLPVLVILFIVGLFYYTTKKPNKYPPGPRWLPIVGCLPYYKKLGKIYGGQHSICVELSKIFNSGVIGLKLGEQLIVGVSSLPLIKEVMASDDYNGRPTNFFGRLRNISSGVGVTCAEGDIWVEQRRFLLRQLRDVGFGKSMMEMKIKHEVQEMMEHIQTSGGDVEIAPLLSTATLNVLWSLVAGSPLSQEDERVTAFLKLLERRNRAFDMTGGTLSMFPWMRFIAPEKIGYSFLKKLNTEIKVFLMELIVEHHKTWTEGNDTDVIYAFISKMKEESGQHSNFTDEQLLMVSFDLFVGGAHTTSSMLTIIYIMMLLNPHIQAKAQKCLDEEFSPNYTVDYTDRLKVPYIEAIILESLRFHHVLPVTGIRRAIRDTELDGYIIPKDTTVLINAYGAFMDKEIWGDPDVFRPERFLDAKGQLNVSKDFAPFTLGKRRCLGEPLARSFLFIFLTEVLRKFTICSMPGAPPPEAQVKTGIVLLPKVRFMRFLKRNV